MEYSLPNNRDTVLRIFFIRHGQTDDNKNEILQGHKNTDLNSVGIKQAEKLCRYFKNRNIKPEKCFSSDLKRCEQTFFHVFNSNNEDRPEVNFSKALRERFMGEVEGLTFNQAENYAYRHSKKSFREFGESLDSFRNRIVLEVTKTVSSCVDLKNIAIITHGGVIRQFITHLKPHSSSTQFSTVHNASVTIIDYNKATNKFEIRDVGFEKHLD